uniref:Uncharacterized protein n=1 Tax=Caenorhabditis tropicalis TaxID=1561998 RepID=A0A1I7TNZ8_9PELO
MGQARIVIFDEDKRNDSQDVQLDTPEPKSDKDQRLGHVEETSSTEQVASLSQSFSKITSYPSQRSIGNPTAVHGQAKYQRMLLLQSQAHIRHVRHSNRKCREKRNSGEKGTPMLCWYPATNKHKCRPRQCYYCKSL